MKMMKTDHKRCSLCGALDETKMTDAFLGVCPFFEYDTRQGLFVHIPVEDDEMIAENCSWFCESVEGMSYGEFIKWRTTVSLLARKKDEAAHREKMERYGRIMVMIGTGMAIAQVLQNVKW